MGRAAIGTLPADRRNAHLAREGHPSEEGTLDHGVPFLSRQLVLRRISSADLLRSGLLALRAYPAQGRVGLA